MTAHIHAALMLQYAQDALETNKPWERWEGSESGSYWWQCEETPSWHEFVYYRRKQPVTKVVTKETGGPAFPNASGDDRDNNGMTLRDYFAAKAMQLAWAAYDQGYTGDPDDVTGSITKHAYQIADAMLKARTA